MMTNWAEKHILLGKETVSISPLSFSHPLSHQRDKWGERQGNWRTTENKEESFKRLKLQEDCFKNWSEIILRTESD